MGGTTETPPTRLRRYVPIFGWLPRYQRPWLTRDAIAGATIWGLLIPEMIAYAGLAGLPPQAGLYTLLASLGLYAILGTSRHLVVAGTSASAVLLFSTITDLKPADPQTYMALAAAMVVLTGLLFVAAGMCRLGFITAFLSKPVMEGFVFGLAIFVTVSQLPKLFGVTKGDGDTIAQLGHLIGHLGDTSVVTLAVGAGALVLLFVLERYVSRVPGGLVVLVVAIAVSAVLDLASHGVATVGAIPTGLPTPNVPDVRATDLWVLLPSAAGMLLVIFSEALGAGQTFAEKHGYRLDPSQEMIALGAANIGSGLLGGLATGGSLSQTAVNDGAGARSQMSTLVAAVLAFVTVIALTPLFTDLPDAVLAALIIHAVSHLMKVGQMRRFHQLVPREFWLGMLTLATVVVLDVLPALIIGVVASVVLLVYRASRPALSILGESATARGNYVDIHRHPNAVTIPGVLVIRSTAPLFYANAQTIQDGIAAEVARTPTPVDVVILDLDANDELDITSLEALERLDTNLQKQQVTLAITHLHGPARDIFDRSGLLAKIGPGCAFGNVADAVHWAIRRSHTDSSSDPDVATD